MSITIDKSGAVVADEGDRNVLKSVPGRYQVQQAASLLVFALDEGTGAVARPGEVLAIAGNIASMPLLGLMNMLGQSRETGRLVVKRGSAERVILMHNGDVASVGSNLPSDRLGVFLVRLGKISEAALADAQNEASRRNKRIGQVLLSKNLIDSHQLWRSIQEQITELFADVVQWSEGSFALYRLAPEFLLPQTPPLPMQGLLLEAVRRADEMSVFRERLPSTAARLRRTSEEVPEAFLHDPDLAVAQRALGVFAPEASVADVAKVLFVAEFDATRACYELVKRGLVEIVKAQPNSQAKLRREDEHKVEVFNVAFREVHDEVVRAGQLTSFTVGVQKYLSDPAHAFRTFFQGIELDHTGALPPATLAGNLSVLSAEGHDPGTVITEALTELTFFMLFQCAAFLDADVDEQLGRRVRLIHASLR